MYIFNRIFSRIINHLKNDMFDRFCLIFLIFWSVYEIIFYNIYKNRINYEVFKINNTIFLGTYHSNKFNSIPSELLNLLINNDNCFTEDKLITELANNDKKVLEYLISLYNLSDEDKFINILSIFKMNNVSFPLSNINSNLVFNKVFLNKIKNTLSFTDDNIDYSTYKIISLKNYFLQYYYIDQYIKILYLIKDKNIASLDHNTQESIIAINEASKLLPKNIIGIENISLFSELFFYYNISISCSNTFYQFISFFANFIGVNNNKILLDDRNKVWLPKIRESIDTNKKTTIFVGQAHLKGIMMYFNNDSGYKIEKYSYFYGKFV